MTKSRNVDRNRKHTGNGYAPIPNASITYAEYKALRDAGRLSAEKTSTGLKSRFARQYPAVIDDGSWNELNLPLFFLGGQGDPGLLVTDDGCLVMFSTEENARQFLRQTSAEVRGFTKVSDPVDLLEILHNAKAGGAEAASYDVAHDTQTRVLCFWIDELIAFAQGLLCLEQHLAAYLPCKPEIRA